MNTSHIRGSFSNSYSVGRSATSVIFQSPTWNRIPHKGMPTLSEDEMFFQIEEIGKQLAHAKSDKEYQQIYTRADELQAQFMSSVSPDRKTLLKEGTDIIGKLIKSGPEYPKAKKQKSISEMSFLEFIFLCKEGKVKFNGEGAPSWSLPSGGTMTAGEVGEDGIELNFSENGSQLLSNSSGGWTYTPTAPELFRGEMFLKFLHGAIDREKKSVANYSPQVGNNGLNVLA